MHRLGRIQIGERALCLISNAQLRNFNDELVTLEAWEREGKKGGTNAVGVTLLESGAVAGLPTSSDAHGDGEASLPA